MMRSRYKKIRSQKGAALLIVLFIILAIAVISSGFIARSDAELACGRNFCIRNEVDYLAWGGLEHARALVISPENAGILGTWSGTGLQLDASTYQYYDLTINNPTEIIGPPSTYTYSIQSSAYQKIGSDIQGRSILDATLYYDPNSSQAYYISVTRQ